MREIIERAKEKWSIAKKVSHSGIISDYKHISVFNDGIEVKVNNIPQELLALFSISNGLILFKDVEYGQWGLKIYPYPTLLNANEQIKSWRTDLNKNDLIIGEFYGDSDLIILSLEDYNFGQVIICTPLDERKDWYFLKMNFEEFLEKYIDSEGEKFWER
jgi:hypothetical protein